MQVNRVNKLRIEVKSKLSKSISISQIELQTNIGKLNQTIDMMTHYEGGEPQGFALNRNSPIKLEREFLIDSES